MLPFCKTCSDKTGGHAKNLKPILPLLVPAINIKIGEIFDSLCISHPWIKSKNLPTSHLITLSPYPPQPSHPPPFPHLLKLTNLSPFPHCQPHHPPTFPNSPPSHLFNPSNLTTLPPTIKALQNNIRLSLSPHWFLREGSQYQNWKANSYSPFLGNNDCCIWALIC